jgi:hypothetical protein
MQPGDLVIIGIGQLTTFNVAGIARVRLGEDGSYHFDNNNEPRHFRNIEMLAIPKEAHPMQRFSRTSRLELIDETDFYEAIISMIN